MRALLATLALVSLSGPAFADLAPPPGYVEKCTVDNYKAPNRVCLSCSADFKRRDRCELEHGAKGYKKMCSTRGASVWSEVWCLEALEPDKEPRPIAPPTPDAPAPVEPTPPKQSGGVEVKAADVTPKRDSKCGAGGLELGLPLVFALTLLGRRRS